MRYAAVVLALLFAIAVARAEDPAGEDRAFVEVLAEKATYFAGEPIRLRLRVGFDREYFRENAVPLFRQEMDVPIQVDAPWTSELRSATVVPAGDRDGDRAGLSFALGGRIVEARRADDETRDGRIYTVLEIERSYVCASPGDLGIPAPNLRFVRATRFEEDFVGGRVALDPSDVIVEGEPLTLRILALPEEGRPLEFTDAVGRFALEASVEEARGAGADLLKLRLTIVGEGNLTLLTAPPPERLAGFHVYGTTDDKGRGRRTITYEIAPLGDDVAEVPPIPFAFFDPGPPAGYHVVRTKAIPLDGRSGALPGSSKDGPGAPRDEIAPGEPRARGWLHVALLVALLVTFLLLLVKVARRKKLDWPGDDAAESDTERARAAGAELRAHLARPGADLADAFVAYLAVHLRCAQPAVIGTDLAARLEEIDVPPELAARAAATLERLVAARYGGETADEQVSLAVLLGELEAVFQAAFPSKEEDPL